MPTPWASEIILLEQWKYETIRRTTHNLVSSHVSLHDFITTFIWQVSILHSIDHQMYAKWSEQLRNASGTKISFQESIKSDKKISDLISPIEQKQYVNFIDVAVKYNYNGDSLDTMKHEDLECQKALENLRKELNEIFKNYLSSTEGISINTNEIAPSIMM